jgi:hypothetical protein
MCRRLCAALLAGLLIYLGPSAPAATLNLDTGKSLTLVQGASDTFTFSFTNTGGGLTEDFLGWILGIQVLPAGGNAGSLMLGTLSQAAINPMPAGSIDITQPTLSTLAGGASINGTAQFYQIGTTLTEPPGGTILSLESYNMGDLGITASGDALGTWNVYAVQQGGANYQSYWTDVTSITDIDFANLPRIDGNSSRLIGTVTITAVPEPGTLGLLAAAALSAIVIHRRRARRC